MKLVKYTATGTKSSLTAEDKVFGVEVNQVLLAQAVRSYMSNSRQGTSQALTRAEVKRTKAKWYAQKGTGRARHGAQSAPIFVGGGVAHGPRGNANWKKKLTKVFKRQALVAALSAQAGNCLVDERILSLDGKTKSAQKILDKIATSPKSKILIILPDTEEKIMRAFNNLSQVNMMQVHDVNALDVATADQIIFTSISLKALEKRLS
jgi:large subunit ribosomal protein L4